MEQINNTKSLIPAVPLNAELAAQPRTALVTQLLELREKYIASGGKLYTADEINNEVRGGR